MKSRKVVINMECDGKAYFVVSLGELFTIQTMDQWVDWLTNPPSGEELPNINWLVAVFPGN